MPEVRHHHQERASQRHIGVPQGEETRCLKLDTIIRNELPRDTLEAYKKLSRLQNFLLDAVGSLAATHNDLVSTNDPDPDRIQQAIQLALRILGNASTKFSQERRSKALVRLNPDLKLLVEDEDFSKLAPFLFVPGLKRRPRRDPRPSHA